MDECFTSPIPKREETKFDTQFKIASFESSKWHLYFSVTRINDFCVNLKGDITIYSFCGKLSKLLGIIAEVDIGISPRDRIDADIKEKFKEVFGNQTSFKIRANHMKHSKNNKT